MTHDQRIRRVLVYWALGNISAEGLFVMVFLLFKAADRDSIGTLLQAFGPLNTLAGMAIGYVVGKKL
jgi:hypothetical protein